MHLTAGAARHCLSCSQNGADRFFLSRFFLSRVLLTAGSFLARFFHKRFTSMVFGNRPDAFESEKPIDSIDAFGQRADQLAPTSAGINNQLIAKLLFEKLHPILNHADMTADRAV